MLLAHHDVILKALSDIFTSISVIAVSISTLTTALLSSHITKKRVLSECDKRIAELAKAYKHGVQMADSRPLPRKRKSRE